jgi:hypothetical protein
MTKKSEAFATCKEMPVILVNKVVDEKKTKTVSAEILKNFA